MSCTVAVLHSMAIVAVAKPAAEDRSHAVSARTQ